MLAMRTFWQFFDRMNLLVWVIGLFAAHLLLYLMLGTDTWLSTSLLATAVWAAVLLVLKLAAGRFAGERQENSR